MLAPAYSAGAYQLSAQQRALAATTTRWVQSTVGPSTKEHPSGNVTRSNYVTDGFALGTSAQEYVTFDIGSAGSNQSYDPQDRMLSLQFAAGSSRLPDVDVQVVTDPIDVYGAVTTDPSGHVKPHHVVPVYANLVQDHGDVLALLNLNLTKAGSDISEYSTNLTLPYALAGSDAATGELDYVSSSRGLDSRRARHATDRQRLAARRHHRARDAAGGRLCRLRGRVLRDPGLSRRHGDGGRREPEPPRRVVPW